METSVKKLYWKNHWTLWAKPKTKKYEKKKIVNCALHKKKKNPCFGKNEVENFKKRKENKKNKTKLKKLFLGNKRKAAVENSLFCCNYPFEAKVLHAKCSSDSTQERPG